MTNKAGDDGQSSPALCAWWLGARIGSSRPVGGAAGLLEGVGDEVGDVLGVGLEEVVVCVGQGVDDVAAALGQAGHGGVVRCVCGRSGPRNRAGNGSEQAAAPRDH